MSLRTALLGATGAVGEEFLRVLEARDFPVGELLPLASPRSAGRTVRFRGEEVEVRALDRGSFSGVDLGLFSAGAATSREAAPWAVEAGAVVIDNSSAFRGRQDVPLVVPEANAAAAEDHAGLIANPNCSTILLAVVLSPLHRAVGVRRAVVATYQAVSGAGARALAEMEAQREAAAAGRPGTTEVFPVQIDLNLFPRIGAIGPDGVSEEEAKMGRELRKILDAPDLEVATTCVRVPVRRAHSEAVHVELGEEISPEEAKAILRDAPGLRLVEPEQATPLEASGGDDVLVSRVRRSPVHRAALDLWLTGDQLRKGAALNAVQIAEHLLARGALPARTR